MRMRSTIGPFAGALALVVSACASGGGSTPSPIDATADAPGAGVDTGAPDAAGPTAGPRRFETVARLADLPGIRDQPTERGRQIGALVGHAGRLFIGYGDYSANTGPIPVLSFDPVAASFDASRTVATEEILRLAALDGALYIADIDPRGHEALGSVFRLVAFGEDWQKMTPIPEAVHVFDVAAFDGRLWAGSATVYGTTARVASSADGGQTWRDELTRPSPAGAFTRFTHLGPVGGELFTAGWVSTDPSERFAYVLRGGQWRPLAGVPDHGYLVPVSLPDVALIFAFDGDPGKGGTHFASYTLLGETLSPTEPLRDDLRAVQWQADPDGRVWLLARNDAGDAVLASTATGWERIADLPPIAPDAFSAIARLDNTVYLGTLGGDLHAVAGLYEAPAGGSR